MEDRIGKASKMSHVRECQQCGETYVPANGTCRTCEERLRRHGIVTGLDMAAKYVAMCNDKEEIAMMIKAALLTLTEPAK